MDSSSLTETVIRPNQRWHAIDWREIVIYRDLLYLLVRRDFVSRFKQTVLGPLWFIINPLITTVVLAVIFGRVMGAAPDNVPPLLFFNAGLIGWNYFSGILSATGNSLQGNAHLFGKVYFPRLIVPMAQTLSTLIGLAIQLMTFAFLYIYVKYTDPRAAAITPSWLCLALPIFLLHGALLGSGAGLILSALSARYRDLQNLSPFLISTLMFVSPVMWSMSKLHEKFPDGAPYLSVVNPAAWLIEVIRVALLGVGPFQFGAYLISFCTSTAVFLLGVILFQRAARTFIDAA